MPRSNSAAWIQPRPTGVSTSSRRARPGPLEAAHQRAVEEHQIGHGAGSRELLGIYGGRAGSFTGESGGPELAGVDLLGWLAASGGAGWQRRRAGRRPRRARRTRARRSCRCRPAGATASAPAARAATPACSLASAMKPRTTSRRLFADVFVARLGADDAADAAVDVAARREPGDGRQLARPAPAGSVACDVERVEAADRPGVAGVERRARGSSARRCAVTLSPPFLQVDGGADERRCCRRRRGPARRSADATASGPCGRVASRCVGDDQPLALVVLDAARRARASALRSCTASNRPRARTSAEPGACCRLVEPAARSGDDAVDVGFDVDAGVDPRSRAGRLPASGRRAAELLAELRGHDLAGRWRRRRAVALRGTNCELVGAALRREGARSGNPT